MIQVAFIDFVFENPEAVQLEGCQFHIHGPLHAPEEIVAAAAGADVLCMRDQFGKVNGSVLERLPRLRLIVTRSTGFDHIDVGAAASHGVPVCNVPDFGAHVISEHAFGLLLAVARNIVKGDERYRRDRFFSDQGLKGIGLRGRTLGVIGAGRIGLQTIRIANGFKMRVIAHDPVENRSAARELGFAFTTLEDLLAQSDVVSLHVPLNKATHHLLDARRLSRMKPGAILINTSRGEVVDTQALVGALRSGQLAGAGLDVLEAEREVYHDFTDLNVVVTPHLGWYTQESVDRILQITLENIAAFLHGEIINRVA